MKKYYLMDAAAVAGALIILILTTIWLPAFWPLYLRTLAGLGIGGICFAIYLVIRPSDEIISLEKELQSTAESARKINQASKNLLPAAGACRSSLETISKAIAQLEMRILRREFIHLGTEIRRLRILAESFASITQFLTGEVHLRPSELKLKISDIEDREIPQVLTTIQELNASIDALHVKRLASAQEELKLITNLYDRNSAAHTAASILMQILEPSDQAGK
jgi:hypothetical protein